MIYIYVSHVNEVMKTTIVIDIHALYGSKTLAGTGAGKAFLPKLLEQSASFPSQALVAVDFRKTDLVTASFFRASFKAFRDHARGEADFFPVFICLEKSTLEEVAAYAEDVGDVFAFADLDGKNEFVRPFLVGRLDEKQDRALGLLAEMGESDAASLFLRFPETPPLSTSAAWSNRLAALSAKGLVAERSEGRSKLFKPIFKELRHGI